jgi:alpha-amylase
MENIYNTYSKVEPYFLDAPFLTNHDQKRSMSYFSNNIQKAELAANIYLHYLEIHLYITVRN